jgi:hypothetical protein
VGFSFYRTAILLILALARETMSIYIYLKKMIGGITGWLDEGFELVKD